MDADKTSVSAVIFSNDISYLTQEKCLIFPKKHIGLQTGRSCFIQWGWVAKRN